MFALSQAFFHGLQHRFRSLHWLGSTEERRLRRYVCQALGDIALDIFLFFSLTHVKANLQTGEKADCDICDVVISPISFRESLDNSKDVLLQGDVMGRFLY